MLPLDELIKPEKALVRPPSSERPVHIVDQSYQDNMFSKKFDSLMF